MKGWKNILIAYGVPLIGLLVYWYFSLTPLTFQSVEFWMNIIIYLAASASLSYFLEPQQGMRRISGTAIVIALSIAAVGIGMLAGSQIFRSHSYADLIEYTEGNFEEDLALSDPSQIPTIDRDMAERLGSRKIGEALDLVSQFDVSNEYTQISYQGRPIRVSPLGYVNFFRWFTNRSEGIPHYVSVDMITGAAELEDLEENLRYSHSGWFNDDINRHIFLQHPTTLFENPVFELDEEGRPHYVAPIVERQFSFLGPKDVVGVFVVDAATGEINRYDLENVPNWVDRVYPANMVMNHINYNGSYQSGYLNSIIAKRGVIQNAEGYNYIVLNNDLYLYTGLTSVASDESNIGFVLVNSRTKEAKRYNVSTATEWSAMESAQGSVQEKGYQSTFPLLFYMNDSPVYQLSLKDEAGLIKLYAFVDALNYQKVGIGSSLPAAWTAFTGGITAIPDEEVDPENLGEVVDTVSGEITAIQAVVVGGETTYYFILDDNQDVIYTAKVSLNKDLPFLQAGDRVTIEAVDAMVRSIQRE